MYNSIIVYMLVLLLDLTYSANIEVINNIMYMYIINNYYITKLCIYIYIYIYIFYEFKIYYLQIHIYTIMNYIL